MSESADGAHVEATPPTAPNLAPPCTAANRTPWDRSSAKRARRDDRALALVRHLLTHPDELPHHRRSAPASAAGSAGAQDCRSADRISGNRPGAASSSDIDRVSGPFNSAQRQSPRKLDVGDLHNRIKADRQARAVPTAGFGGEPAPDRLTLPSFPAPLNALAHNGLLPSGQQQLPHQYGMCRQQLQLRSSCSIPPVQATWQHQPHMHQHHAQHQQHMHQHHAQHQQRPNHHQQQQQHDGAHSQQMKAPRLISSMPLHDASAAQHQGAGRATEPSRLQPTVCLVTRTLSALGASTCAARAPSDDSIGRNVSGNGGVSNGNKPMVCGEHTIVSESCAAPKPACTQRKEVPVHQAALEATVCEQPHSGGPGRGRPLVVEMALQELLSRPGAALKFNAGGRMLSLGSQGETPRCSPIGSPIGSPKASQGGSRRGTPATDVPSQVSSPQLAQPPAAAAAQSSQQPPPCHIPLSVAPAQTAQWHYSATAMGPVTSGRSGLGAARASPLLQCRVSSSNPISDDMIGGARRLAHEGKPRAPDQGRHTQSTVNTTACDESQPAIASRSVDPSGTSAHNKSVSQAWSCQAVAPGSRSAGGVFDLEDVKPQSPLPDPRERRPTNTERSRHDTAPSAANNPLQNMLASATHGPPGTPEELLQSERVFSSEQADGIPAQGNELVSRQAALVLMQAVSAQPLSPGAPLPLLRGSLAAAAGPTRSPEACPVVAAEHVGVDALQVPMTDAPTAHSAEAAFRASLGMDALDAPTAPSSKGFVGNASAHTGAHDDLAGAVGRMDSAPMEHTAGVDAFMEAMDTAVLGAAVSQVGGNPAPPVVAVAATSPASGDQCASSNQHALLDAAISTDAAEPSVGRLLSGAALLPGITRDGAPGVDDAALVDIVAASHRAAMASDSGQPGSVPLTPCSTGRDLGLRQDERDIGSYLGPDLAAKYRKTTDWRLYEWQAECLLRKDLGPPSPAPDDWQPRPPVLKGGNLVYCAPTSGGKTLVAEVLMLRQLLSTKKAAILVLPFVALCTEKVRHLKTLLEACKRTVVESFGPNSAPVDITPATGVIVCTIEKANTLINRLIDTDALQYVCCVVVDELHMVGDDSRGDALELLLTKLRFACKAARHARQAALEAANSDKAAGAGEPAGMGGAVGIVASEQPPVKATSSFDGTLQVVGMSATIPNVHQVAQWLDAHLYITSWRPVPLTLRMLEGDVLMDADGVKDRALAPERLAHMGAGDPLRLRVLCAETVDTGHSVLLFCGAKKECERVAKHLSFLNIAERPLRPGAAPGLSRAEAVDRLRRVHGGNAALLAAVERGVAFHNAGLLGEEKEVVEEAFTSGAVRVLTATSSLAAGVNLPARRVIFKDHFTGFDKRDNWLDATKFRQMAGRAGRAGMDDVGEAIVLATGRPATDDYLRQLMKAEARPVGSCLGTEGSMRRAMLEVIANGSVCRPQDISSYLGCTLLFAIHDDPARRQELVANAAVAALQWLQQEGLIKYIRPKSGGKGWYVATTLGAAAVASGMSPADSLVLNRDLLQSGGCLNTFCDLHSMYLCTQVADPALEKRSEDKRFWDTLSNIVRQANKIPSKREVLRAIGVSEHHIQRRTFNTSFKAPEEDRRARRLFAAHLLLDLMAEESHDTVLSRYGLDSGGVDNRQEHAGHFASGVVAFCARMEYHALSGALSVFVERIFRSKSQIVALVDVDGVKKHSARLLYKANIKTVDDIVEASEDAIRAILIKGASKHSRGNEGAIARKIKQGAVQLLEQRVNEGVAEAEAHRAAVSRKILEQHGPRKGRPMTQKHVPLPDPDAVPKAPESRNVTPPALQIVPLPPQGSIVVQAEQLLAFLRKWARQPTWAVVLCCAPGAAELPPSLEIPPTPRAVRTAGARAADTKAAVLGLAVTWGTEAAYYLPLQLLDPPQDRRGSSGSGTTTGGGSTGASEPNAQALLAAILRDAATEKAMWDAKTQLQAIKSAGLRGRLPLGIGMVDLRVAYWMLHPDSRQIGDSLRPEFLKPPMSRQERQDRVDKSPYSAASLLQKLIQERIADPNPEAALRGGLVGAPLLPASRLPAAREALRAALHAWALWGALKPKLEAENLLEPLRTIEMPLARALVDMELSGIAACPVTLHRQRAPLERRIKELEGQVQQIASVHGPCDARGRCPTFNLEGPRDVSDLLFHHLRLPPPPAAKQYSSGSRCTNAEVLEQLVAGADPAHPPTLVPGLILEHRHLCKIVNGFLTDLEQQVGSAPADATPLVPSASQPQRSASGGAPATPQPAAVPYGAKALRRLRTRFNQTMTATGRLSTDELNMQCMPRPRTFSVPVTQLTTPGRPDHRDQTSNLRAVFRAPPGRVILSADYKHMELRVMAFLAREHVLWGPLCDERRDPFRDMASMWLRCHPDQVSEQQRGYAKALAYGLLFGKGAHATAHDLGCTVREAEGHIETFKASLPAVRAWMDSLVAAAAEDDFVTTLGGRRRYFRNLKTGNQELRAAEARAAINTVSQGSGADIAKIAMARLHVALATELPHSCARIVHMMHDELVLEVREDVLAMAARITRRVMSEALPLILPPGHNWSQQPGQGTALPMTLPMPVKLRVGPSWGELGDYEPTASGSC